MRDAARIAEGIKRGVGRLSPALQGQLQALVTPQALAVAAGFFMAWLVSHAVGIGFVVDAVFLGVGVVAVLLRRAPQTFRGRHLSVGPPPANAGFVLRPGLRSTRAMGPGEGATSSWGEPSPMTGLH